MRRLLRTLSTLLCLTALLATSLAHAQAEVNLRIDRVDDSAFPKVRLFTTVTDAQGHALPGLKPDSFVLREGGRSVPLTSVTSVPANEIELRVVLAIDISKSIEPSLDQIRTAATGFVKSLAANDQVALVVFGNTARVVQPFTTDHGAVINSILSIGPAQLEDYTALYNGVFEGVRLAADGASSGRRAVVVLTDGDNTIPPGSDSLALTDVQRGASERRVPVHVIAVGKKLSDQELRIIATDGSFLRVDQPDQLAAAYTSIAGQLRQQYLISYTSQLPADGSTYPFDLSVNVPDAGTAQATTNLRAALPTTHAPTSQVVATPLSNGTATTGPDIPLWVWLAIAALVILLISISAVLLLRHRREAVASTIEHLSVGSEQKPVSIIKESRINVNPDPNRPDRTQVDRTAVIDPNHASLVVEQGDATPAKIHLKAGKDVLIGRQPDADLVINDKLASAQHARIRFLEGGFTIADNNSTNGMFVNGHRVERVRLQDNDRIAIAGVTLVFKQVRGKG